jgi:hypothetical protein
VLLAGWIAGWAAGSPLWADNRVAVRAKADPDYEAQKFGGATPKDQTYLFFQGRFFGGTTRDTVLEKMPFMQIATTLAAGLAKQHYFPTRDLLRADLLIIVHWGVTTVTVSDFKLQGRTTLVTQDGDAQVRQMIKQLAEEQNQAGVSDPLVQSEARVVDDFLTPGALAHDEMLQRFDALAEETSNASNARLLGFTDDLQKDRQSFFGTCEGTMLRSMLADERYFVVVLAYDYQALLREQKHKLLWSARLSMQSPGMNFRAGVGNMSNAGSVVFGHETDGVKVRLPPERETKVEIGPVRVLSMPATP